MTSSKYGKYIIKKKQKKKTSNFILYKYSIDRLKCYSRQNISTTFPQHCANGMCQMSCFFFFLFLSLWV